MLDYRIVEANSCEDLTQQVKKLLTQGYALQGGPYAACWVGTNRDDEVISSCSFYQAVVKEDSHG